MHRFWKGILLTAFAGLTLGAAEIAAVKFDQQGADPIPTDMLYVTLRLRQGMEFKREYLDEDIKNLFATYWYLRSMCLRMMQKSVLEPSKSFLLWAVALI